MAPFALWALCHLGQALRWKAYIMEAADAERFILDDNLRAVCVKRFLAERQDG